MQAGAGGVRQNRPGAGIHRDRPISHPPSTNEGEEDQEPKLPPQHFKRRQTMPEMMLKEELAKMRPRGKTAANNTNLFIMLQQCCNTSMLC